MLKSRETFFNTAINSKPESKSGVVKLIPWRCLYTTRVQCPLGRLAESFGLAPQPQSPTFTCRSAISSLSNCKPGGKKVIDAIINV